jgi:hypothetical protein
MPIIGIVASSFPRNPVGEYDLIETITSNGSATGFEFLTIPQTYRYLEIRGYGSNTTGGYRNVAVRVNGNTGNIYRYGWVWTNNNTMGAVSNNSDNHMPILQSFAPGDQMSVGLWHISNYTSSNAKTFVSYGGAKISTGTTGELSYGIGTAVTSAPITSLLFFNTSGNTWTNGTEFSLYGVK